MRKFLILIPMALLLTFCAANSPAAPTPDMAAIVNATLTAFVPEQVDLLPVPTLASGGSISGRLGYPSEAIPPLKVVAFRVGGSEFFFVETALNQADYRIDNLPEGKYNVVAYTLGGDSFPVGLSGGYTQAVLCGMTEACTEHTLVDVIVFNGEESMGVDIIDWLQPNFPPMP
ncbi:MAG: hypothetical protein CVU44_19510 [Chloroflexi bacterium HGW-Chloroflexi-6]|nr:MAG: hypothetical protein CVU44_19510 [Chloroflexi bacterium HGW-Chloroflexi-6]